MDKGNPFDFNRSLWARQGSVSAATTSTQLTGRNPRRVRLTISAPATDSVWVSFGTDAAAGVTFFISSSHSPVTFCLCDYGPLICEPVNVISNGAGAVQVGYVEVEDSSR